MTMIDNDTERLLTELEAFTAPDNGQIFLSKFRSYLKFRNWNESAGNGVNLWLQHGQKINLPNTITQRRDLTLLANAIDTVATLEVCYRVDIMREILSIEYKVGRTGVNVWLHS